MRPCSAVLKHFVVRAFKAPGQGNGLATSDAIGKAVPVLLRHATIEDPADPWRKLHNEIASTLFIGNDAIAYDRRKNTTRNLDGVDRDLLVAALRSFFTNVNGYARGGASKILDHLDEETLEPLWRDVFMASLLPSPSGVMNHQEIMTNGVRLMAKKGFEEGAMLGAIQIRRPGWGEERRVQQIAGILPEFGAVAERFEGDVVPYIQSLIEEEKERAEKRGELRPQDQKQIRDLQALVAAFENPLPARDLKSMAPFLKEGDLELAKELLEYYPTKTERWNKNGF